MSIFTHWPETIDLSPGGHTIILGYSWEIGLEGRRRGLELRDTLLIVSAQEPRFAFLFRAGLEGTVAENILKHGTGGLNIDGCRVTTGESLTGGRWPTNMVFVHGEGCKRDGVKTVRGTPPTPSGFDRYNKALQQQGYRPGEYQMGEPPTPPSRVDSSGQETIPNWICSENCPVLALDDQGKRSGIHSSGSPRGYKAGYTTEPGYTGSWSTNPYGGMRHDDGDQGSCASRFFPQFENEAALMGWLKTLIGAV